MSAASFEVAYFCLAKNMSQTYGYIPSCTFSASEIVLKYFLAANIRIETANKAAVKVAAALFASRYGSIPPVSAKAYVENLFEMQTCSLAVYVFVPDELHGFSSRV